MPTTPRRKLLRLIESLFTGEKLKGILLSFLSGIPVVGIFYLLEYLVPADTNFYNEIVNLLFIILSVFILFPARDSLIRIFLKKTEYNRIFGSESHHIDFIARRYTVNSILHEIFPELMTWMGIDSCRMAILDPIRKSYSFYILRRGKLIERQATTYRKIEDIISFLRIYRKPVLVFQHGLPENVRDFMEKFRVYLMVPFIYRKKPMGFLILNEAPAHRYSMKALDLFARKAAVTIHNDWLSARAADTGFYRKEFSGARKVQKLIQAGPALKTGHYQVRVIRARNLPAIVEYIPGADGKMYVTVAATGGFQGAAGIVLTGVVGRLYSLRQIQQNVDLHEILKCLRKDQESTLQEFRPDILVIQLGDREEGIAIHGDANFTIGLDHATPAPESNHRGPLQLPPGALLTLFHRARPLLEVKAGSGGSS